MDEKKELEAQEPDLPSVIPEAELTPADDIGTDGEELPVEDRIFGMKRRTFYLVVVGYALGIIVVSLMGIAGLLSEDAGTVVPGVVGAAIGYALAAYLDKRDAANASNEPKP